jgi:signal transduction histidine kinase
LENTQFTSEGVVSVGVVSVGVTREKKKQDDHQEVVEDTGSGISPEILPRLFTKYSQGYLQNFPPSLRLHSLLAF